MGVLKGLFRPRPAVAAGQALYGRAVEQAREPAFYARMGVADSAMGRFELYSLHVALLVIRLKGRAEASAETVQALFDAYLLGLDIGLRELGVGDLSVGKKMKKFGQSFYSRVGSYEAALARTDNTDLEALIARTIYEGRAGVDVGPLAAYVRTANAHLQTQADERLLAGSVEWLNP